MIGSANREEPTMSIYDPKPEHLKAVRRADGKGWDLCDQFGPLDGPYATEGDAIGAAAPYFTGEPA